MKKFKRQYHLDYPDDSCDEKGWQKDAEIFDYPGDLYIETMELWDCEDFSMELLAWCENAKIGDIYEDDDIRVTVIEQD